MRRLIRLLPVVAVVVAPLLSSTPASAACNTTTGLPFNGYVVACVNGNGCLIYQDSGSTIHVQNPVCISL